MTANFGLDFVDLTAVQAATGDGLTFRSSTAQTLVATDNLNGTFTVAAINVVPEPASIALWSVLGLGLIGFGVYRRRRN